MLTTLKSLTQGWTWDAAKAEATVKGKQLALGRAKKTIEARTAELTQARERLSAAQQALGEAIDTGTDPSTASQMMMEAEQLVKQQESALAVAQQRCEAAQRELKNAEGMARAEQEEAALARLKYQVAPKLDGIMAELEKVIEKELKPAMDDARVASGAGAGLNFMVNMTQGLEMFVARAISSIAPKGRAYIPLLGDRVFADLVPDPTTVRARRERTQQGRIIS